ncbi:hypothetical protein O4H53_16795 [Sulfitobacter sp. G21635-S1]|nr:hypothetical protein [Sulfitobacter sp. G21635-S1]
MHCPVGPIGRIGDTGNIGDMYTTGRIILTASKSTPEQNLFRINNHAPDRGAASP